MSEKSKHDLTTGVLVTFIILVLLLVLLLFPLPSRSDEVNQQVVLQVVSNGTEQKLIVPKATVVLRLIPVSGPTAHTPLSRGDNMICRVNDIKDETGNHAGFKCGSDVYVIASIRYDSK
jgi:hypothetical protein